jgi:N-acetyl sugar amidotransferase
MRYCQRCVLPDTKPGVVFDSEGVCSACRSVERKKAIDWKAREEEFKLLCDKIRGSNGNGYECIIPVSGGKDSIYQTYMMKKIHNLRVLCVVVAPHLQTTEGIENLNSLVINLGADLIKVSVKPSTLQKLRTKCLFQIGNPNWAEHRVVFSAVTRMALFYHVPLVVWGEDIAVEFGGTVKQTDGSADDLIENDLFREANIQNFMGEDILEKDLFFYNFPDRDEIRKRKIKSIYLGYYYWWNGYEHYLLAKQFGFKPRMKGPLSGNVLDYDNIDEKLCEIHIWFKFLKFGFWRPTDQCCYHIWTGMMTREKAVKLVNAKQYEFPAEYLPEFLEYHSITEYQFWEAAERFRNKDIWRKTNGEWRLKTPLH